MSPYDALLAQMEEVLDMIDSQTSFDNAEARKVYDECARRIHHATVPDPLYQRTTRPPAIDEALEGARTAGVGFLRIARREDGLLTWENLPSWRVSVQTEGETE